MLPLRFVGLFYLLHEAAATDYVEHTTSTKREQLGKAVVVMDLEECQTLCTKNTECTAVHFGPLKQGSSSLGCALLGAPLETKKCPQPLLLYVKEEVTTTVTESTTKRAPKTREGICTESIVPLIGFADLQMQDADMKAWRTIQVNATHAEIIVNGTLKFVEIGPDDRFACPMWRN